mgnify:CR=1 FL=1
MEVISSDTSSLLCIVIVNVARLLPLTLSTHDGETVFTTENEEFSFVVVSVVSVSVVSVPSSSGIGISRVVLAVPRLASS